MTQRWSNLLFAHWPVATEPLRALVPRGLTLDLHQGTAWVTIAPFQLSNLRLRGTPALPWISQFLELNVRTYVTLDGKPGVYFFSLDAASALAVMGARALYHLPYFRADMQARERADSTIDYESRRVHRGAPPARLSASYAPDGPVARAAPGSLDHWLTERYCLYAVDAASRVYRGEIHHNPWPLQPARVELRHNTMAAASGIELPADPPRASFSRRIDVVVWAIEQVR